jgi:translation initiation factor IF-2
MPVRIYDIARKLGIASKDVLVHTKEMGIENAKVASSSLDKITAEYVEQEILKKIGPTSDAPAEEPKPVVEKAPEPVVKFITEDPKPEEPAASDEADSDTVTAEDSAADPVAVETEAAAEPEEESPATTEEEVLPVSEEPAAQTDEAVAEPEVETEEVSAEPAEPAAAETGPEPAAEPESNVGKKVGFIDLSSFGPRRTATRDRDKRKDKKDIRPERAAAKPKSPKFSAPKDAPAVIMKPPIIVRDLAEKMNRKPFQIIADLTKNFNVFANVNQAIEEDVAAQLCAKNGFNFEVEKRAKGEGVRAIKKIVKLDQDDKDEDLKARPPVITIMGHVDHGKTTLLDTIRSASVVSGEAGGITQHIGAYTITVPHPENKKKLAKLTFLDTPGHAAFSAMRARGADVTDIVILVVGADDGVKPQTKEALDHAKAAEVPIIVALNKCDHPSANTMMCRQQLQEAGLTPDDWGGETIFVEVSALKGDNVPKLLEMILLQAELLELKANPNRPAVGNVIESGLQAGGPTATVLVRKGTLKVGDIVICGHHYGRVRALINEEGERLQKAEPSFAVKVLGLNGVPYAGDEFSVVKKEKEARNLVEERADEAKQREITERRPKFTLNDIFAKTHSDQAKGLKIVVKADTQGSVEAIVDALNKFEHDLVSLEVIHNAVGTVTESDVLLASASQAIILGFHTRIDTGVNAIAKREGVQIKLYAIIYELIDQVKDALTGLLPPVEKDVTTGVAEVRQLFDLSKGGTVAGCVVKSGRISRGKVRVLRQSDLMYEGITDSLRRFQEEVNEIRTGLECGIRVSGFDDFKEGDTIECYTVESVKQKL